MEHLYLKDPITEAMAKELDGRGLYNNQVIQFSKRVVHKLIANFDEWTTHYFAKYNSHLAIGWPKKVG